MSHASKTSRNTRARVRNINFLVPEFRKNEGFLHHLLPFSSVLFPPSSLLFLSISLLFPFSSLVPSLLLLPSPLHSLLLLFCALPLFPSYPYPFSIPPTLFPSSPVPPSSPLLHLFYPFPLSFPPLLSLSLLFYPFLLSFVLFPFSFCPSLPTPSPPLLRLPFPYLPPLFCLSSSPFPPLRLGGLRFTNDPF